MNIDEINNKYNFYPRVIDKKHKYINSDELKTFLNTKHKNKIIRFFCMHDWIYWRFENFGKMHRVCKKCYTKQQNCDPINKFNCWTKEKHFK
jgi:hypothetical protein